MISDGSDGLARSDEASGRAPIRGGELYYRVRGDGAPVILIHGNTLDTRMWRMQLGGLGSFRLVAYDMRGFGRSSPLTSEPYSTADDLANLCDHLEIASAHLVGHSRGGPIAIAYTLAHPARVRSLTLADAGIFGFPFSADYQSIYDRILKKARAGDIEAAKEVWLGCDLFAPARRQPRIEAALRQMVDDHEPFLWTNADPDVASRTDQVTRLHEIALPCLVVVGSLDLPYFRAAAELLCERIPGARGYTIEGAGHMTPMEAPAEFNAVVGGFLGRL